MVSTEEHADAPEDPKAPERSPGAPAHERAAYEGWAAPDEPRPHIVVGVEVSEPFHFGPDGQLPGVHPDRSAYASFAKLSDPDGNGWLLQEVRERRAG